jgi:rfaE bifunctional protein nucleotidyltransferase chain/domain
MRHPEEKILGWQTLLRLRKQWGRDGKTIVWTNGCFDLLHVGHIRSLVAARSLGDILVVGVNSDSSVRRLKGKDRPVIPGLERVEMLAALECIDYVITFSELTPERALFRLKPDVHCKGIDYAPPHGKPIPEAPLVESYGGRIEFLPMFAPRSTTSLISSIRKNTKDS